jgi:hypothetical protein
VATEEGKTCSDGAATVAWTSRPAAGAAAQAASSNTRRAIRPKASNFISDFERIVGRGTS